MAESWKEDAGSFRDPAGRLGRCGDSIRRTISPNYADTYRTLMGSGLYADLVGRGLLIRHTEIATGNDGSITISPEIVPLITYPYEWPFRHLQSAAIATLDNAITALHYNMVIKDAGAFNIQWYNGQWTLIDTLSFVCYEEGTPWIAYTQFLRHFLYPLLFRVHHIPYPYWQNIDGIPPHDAARLLPKRFILNLRFAPHIYPLTQYGGDYGKGIKMPKKNLVAFLQYLRSSVLALNPRPQKGWKQYNSCSYSAIARDTKESTVTRLLLGIKRTVKGVTGESRLLDIGANTGLYTRLARDAEFSVVALDSDHDCADSIAPLSLWNDICNPSPSLGWDNQERSSLLDRLATYNKNGTVLALALIHHLCISNNVPISMVIEMFAMLGKHLIVEFVPPDDPMAAKLGQGREFPAYDEAVFLKELAKRYRIKDKVTIEHTSRTIYHAVRITNHG